MERCHWCGTDPVYVAYHDTEWGVPEYDSRALWEKLVLDGFQAGLSWITILRKRDAFREVFEGFDPERVARWGAPQIDAALTDARIVRSRAKIESAVRGARAWERIESREGFSAFLWRYVDGVPLQPRPATAADVPARTELSARIAADLKAEGFSFCGPVIVQAFLEATGLINDHVSTCFRQAEVAALTTS